MRTNREWFGDIRPAGTVVKVRRLQPSPARVEIEATAMIEDTSHTSLVKEIAS